MSNVPYSHFDYLHNSNDPEIIVPELISLFHPESVIDVGCGIGNFLKAFKDRGVNEVLGLDGSWVNREQLLINISPDEFIESDLEKSIGLDRKFDLLICLEVAEHLSDSRADSFIKELTQLSKLIVFSAAVPGQGGTNHINEQWPEYWGRIFSAYGYRLHDVFKSLLWDKDIHWWYKQNMYLALPEETDVSDLNLEYSKLGPVIHPELFASRIGKMSSILEGRASTGYYFKLLLKSVARKLKLWN